MRPSGTISESAPTCVAGSQRPATCQPSAVLDPVDDALEQADLVAPDGSRARARRPRRRPRPGPRRPGRWACRLRGSRGARSGWVSLDESPPVPPSRQARGLGARADVEGPGAGRAVEGLVAGEGEQVDRRGAQVDRDDAGRLRGVDQEQGARPRGRSARSPRSAGRSRARWRRASGRPARSSGVSARRIASGSR